LTSAKPALASSLARVFLDCTQECRGGNPTRQMIFSTCSKPFPDALRHHRVSTRVNSVKNDDPACTEEFIPNLLF